MEYAPERICSQAWNSVGQPSSGCRGYGGTAAALRGGRKELNAVMSGGVAMTRPGNEDLRQVDDSVRFMQRVPKVIYIRDPGNEVRVFVEVPRDAELSRIMR